ncbi:uncharacterized protein LOC109809808 [Cajanus cajan]|uniref:Uncharacterized protein n=1 Tax=Cajanus cajan TaxID=3821 RepID=A0A151SI93_CAJCA|nr:uncharacterized protein LOC109809808 [Cajanus cajan]KYP54451.1 hypothetical protein KK1_000639 [Cajanus cajan]
MSGKRETIMGAKRLSSHPFCGVLKTCFSGGRRYDYEYVEGSGGGRRIFASDEDREHWVAEPGIDRKASDFIARYYATRVTDSHRQFAS